MVVEEEASTAFVTVQSPPTARVVRSRRVMQRGAEATVAGAAVGARRGRSVVGVALPVPPVSVAATPS